VQSVNYEQATVAYRSGDYPSALRGFYRCLKEDFASFGPGDAGLVYHRLGNCLLKMRNLNEALATYRKALEDDRYADRGGVLVNIGTTLNGLKRNQEAIACFDQALAEADYHTPYKAQLGLGNAYSRLGMLVEAGSAYRKAALDEGNPNPIKALNNLGVTFMSLERPLDAVEAYLAIIDFKASGQVLNKTYEQLGSAYAAAQRYPEALAAFEDALRDGSYTLSGRGREDYERANLSLGGGDLAYGEPDYSGLDTSVYDVPMSEGENFGQAEGYGAGGVPAAENTGFFTATDADLMRMSKSQMRKVRKLKHTGLKVFCGFVIALIALLGTAVFLYTQGYGFPTQEKIITDFFDAQAQGKDVSPYWVVGDGVDPMVIERILDGVAPSSDISIVSVERSMEVSTALVRVNLAEGGIIHYRITLARDLLSWRIYEIVFAFASASEAG
jgi:tetratricopeptide (TPR) repeat protein